MLQVEQPIVLVTLASKSKVDAGAVLGGGPDEVGHDAGDVKGQLPLGLLGHLFVLHRSVLRYAVTLPQLSTTRPTRPLGGRSLEGHLPFGLKLLLPPRL